MINPTRALAGQVDQISPESRWAGEARVDGHAHSAGQESARGELRSELKASSESVTIQNQAENQID